MSAQVRSYSVGQGDMFTVHDFECGSQLTVIDCCLNEDREAEILNSLKKQADFIRFISTHPDNDHIKGFSKLQPLVRAFWAPPNGIESPIAKGDLKAYLEATSGMFSITAGSYITYNKKRIGFDFLWPDERSLHYINAVHKARLSGSDWNDTSPIITYSYQEGGRFMWMGDLSSTFLAEIEEKIDWPKVDVLFAPHHGRDRVPATILSRIKPKFIVIGEAAKEDLEYYRDYCEICQNTAGDVVFECANGYLHVYLSGTASEKIKKYLEKLPDKERYTWYVGSKKVVDS